MIRFTGEEKVFGQLASDSVLPATEEWMFPSLTSDSADATKVMALHLVELLMPVFIVVENKPSPIFQSHYMIVAEFRRRGILYYVFIESYNAARHKYSLDEFLMVAEVDGRNIDAAMQFQHIHDIMNLAAFRKKNMVSEDDFEALKETAQIFGPSEYHDGLSNEHITAEFKALHSARLADRVNQWRRVTGYTFVEGEDNTIDLTQPVQMRVLSSSITGVSIKSANVVSACQLPNFLFDLRSERKLEQFPKLISDLEGELRLLEGGQSD